MWSAHESVVPIQKRKKKITISGCLYVTVYLINFPFYEIIILSLKCILPFTDYEGALCFTGMTPPSLGPQFSILNCLRAGK